MSIISGDAVDEYYIHTPYRMYSVNMGAIQNKAQADEITAQCISDGRMERLKAVGCCILGAGAAAALCGMALLAAKITILAVGVLVFPLSIIPPLYNLATTVCGVGVGGAIGYITIKRFAKQFFIQSKEHWAYADHLFQQAHAVRLKRALFRDSL